MKKFLISLSLLALAFLITLVAGECLVESLPNQYKSKNEYMQRNGADVETIILGSSHAYYGINPEYLDGNAYNLANISQNYRYDYYLLSHYADKYKQLKTVIVPVSYFSFFRKPFEEGNDEALHHVMSYHIYMDCPYDDSNPKYKWEFSHFSIFRGKIMAWARNSVRNCSSLGWGMDYALALKQNKMDIGGVKRAHDHTVYDWTYLPENLSNLTNILEFCKARSVKVVLITTPTYRTYYDNLDPNQLNKMYSLIDSLKQQYRFDYKDYLKDSRFVLDDFWEDCDHLSDVGATKFTKILNEDIR
jgi:hypothetical protein